MSDQVVTKCWFELHRQGGCGAAELVLTNDFDQRKAIEIGDWISFGNDTGQPWYLGRVEERRTQSPAVIKLRLQGMGIEFNEVFPGGFGTKADGKKPHRYAATDLFSHDPDRSDETVDSVSDVQELVHLLMTQYVVPKTNISYHADRVESPVQSAPLTSLKLRGEESVRAILKELAIRSRSASWGVDAQGEFFFLNPVNTVLATYREGQHLTSLSEIRDYELLFNRILLTGDYVYDRREGSEFIARRSFRWRGNFVEPNSQAQFGDRRLKLWLPWIRTQADSLSFAREFFRIYSQPTNRYLIETAVLSELPRPWEGRITLEDQTGKPLITARIETIRVLFDHQPRFRMELGPEDPRLLWSEPPHDERWELPDEALSIGGSLSLSLSDDPPPPPPPPPPPSSSQDWTSTSDSSSGSESSANSSGSDGSSGSSGSAGSSDYPTSSSDLWTSATSYSSQISSDLSLVSSSLPSSFDDNSTVATSSELTSLFSSDTPPSSEISESEPSLSDSSATNSTLSASSEQTTNSIGSSDSLSSNLVTSTEGAPTSSTSVNSSSPVTSSLEDSGSSATNSSFVNSTSFVDSSHGASSFDLSSYEPSFPSTYFPSSEYWQSTGSWYSTESWTSDDSWTSWNS